MAVDTLQINENYNEKYGFHDASEYAAKAQRGLTPQVVRDISYHKSEPEWMTKFRLNALKRFERKPMLEWFSKNMPTIDFDDIYYYLKPTQGAVSRRRRPRCRPTTAGPPPAAAPGDAAP